MADIQQPKKIVKDPYEMADILMAYAEKVGKLKTIKEKLASALIYSALAEFFCEELIKVISEVITVNNDNHNVGFISDTLSKVNNSNLGSALKKLEKLNYPHKKLIEKEIITIKHSRDQVFHNLVRVHEKKVNMNYHIEVIQGHTPVLRGLVIKSLETMN